MKVITNKGEKKVTSNDLYWFLDSDSSARTKHYIVLGDMDLNKKLVSTKNYDPDSSYIIDGDIRIQNNRVSFKISDLIDLIYPKGDSYRLFTKAIMGAHANDTGFAGAEVFQGKLYFASLNSTVSNTSSGAKLFVYDGTSFSTYTKQAMGLPSADHSGSRQFCVYKNRLYFEMQNSSTNTDRTATCLIAFDGTNFQVYTKSDIGLNANDTRIMPLGIYQNKLFLATSNSTAATDLTAAKIILFDGTSFVLIPKSNLGCVNADTSFNGLAEFNGKAYMGTYNTTAATDINGAKLLVYDGTTWSTILKSQINCVAGHTLFPAFLSTGSYLYISVYSTNTSLYDYQGTKILVYDGTKWREITRGSSTPPVYIWSLAYFNGALCAGGQKQTTGVGFACYTQIDCRPFQANLGSTMPNYQWFIRYNSGESIHSMKVFNGSLYIFTYNAWVSSDMYNLGPKVICKGTNW